VLQWALPLYLLTFYTQAIVEWAVNGNGTALWYLLFFFISLGLELSDPKRL